MRSNSVNSAIQQWGHQCPTSPPLGPQRPATCLPQGTGLLRLSLKQQSIFHLLLQVVQGLLQLALQGSEGSQ